MEEEILTTESNDGIRMAYNVLPNIPVPISASLFYNPLMPTMFSQSQPVSCSNCHAYLNPYNTYTESNFTCVLCNSTQRIPIGAEECTEYSSCIYRLQKTDTPNFVLVVDSCTFDEERHALMQEAVDAAISTLPECNMFIVLINTNVQIVRYHNDTKVNHLFAGKVDYSKEKLEKINFYSPKSKYDGFILPKTPFPVQDGQRPARCTGSALSLVGNYAVDAQILLLLQGPCTIGPGTIVGEGLTQHMRSVSELYGVSADAFYTRVADMIFRNRSVVHIFAATINDVGIYEMQPIIKLGGDIILAQDFDRDILLNGIHSKKYFSKVSIKGKSSAGISDLVFYGRGRLIDGCFLSGSLNSSSTTMLTFKCDPVPSSVYFIQLYTSFTEISKEETVECLSVTTLCCNGSNNRTTIRDGIDEEALAIALARTVIIELENDKDLTRRIEKLLIRAMRAFPDLMYFPNFVYFLRRSLIVKTHYCSPDEVYYYRYLLTWGVGDAMCLIVPSLIMYHYSGETKPVELDLRSLDSESIMLMDSFTHVVLWMGASLCSWINEGYDKDPEYACINLTIQRAKEDALGIVNSRWPRPFFVECADGSSQERLVKARVSCTGNDEIDYESFMKLLDQAIRDDK